MPDEIEKCMLCPRQCGARRQKEMGSGYCGMGSLSVVARAALHFWEEPCISGSRGSGTVFFTGCSLKCVFCQNYEISTKKRVGKIMEPHELAKMFQQLEAQGAHNINLVNPTHFVSTIAQALKMAKLQIPVVYNTSSYELVETLKMLEGFVDIYLPDYKYANNALAEKYSSAPDYVEYAGKAILEMVRQTGAVVFDEDGMIRKGTIVRHLILPSNTKNSIAALKWLKENLPNGALVSLMAQYIPCGQAGKYPEINRKITKREFMKVQNYLFDLDLEGFVQEMSAAKQKYIPPFQLEEFL